MANGQYNITNIHVSQQLLFWWYPVRKNDLGRLVTKSTELYIKVQNWRFKYRKQSNDVLVILFLIIFIL